MQSDWFLAFQKVNTKLGTLLLTAHSSWICLAFNKIITISLAFLLCSKWVFPLLFFNRGSTITLRAGLKVTKWRAAYLAIFRPSVLCEPFQNMANWKLLASVRAACGIRSSIHLPLSALLPIFTSLIRTPVISNHLISFWPWNFELKGSNCIS